MKTIQSTLEEGIAVLKALGRVMEDEEHVQKGNILIEDLTIEKYRLIRHILTYVGLTSDFEDVCEFLYRDEFYVKTDESVISQYNEFNSVYTYGVFINVKELEKKIEKSVQN